MKKLLYLLLFLPLFAGCDKDEENSNNHFNSKAVPIKITETDRTLRRGVLFSYDEYKRVSRVTYGELTDKYDIRPTGYRDIVYDKQNRPIRFVTPSYSTSKEERTIIISYDGNKVYQDGEYIFSFDEKYGYINPEPGYETDLEYDKNGSIIAERTEWNIHEYEYDSKNGILSGVNLKPWVLEYIVGWSFSQMSWFLRQSIHNNIQTIIETTDPRRPDKKSRTKISYEYNNNDFPVSFSFSGYSFRIEYDN